VRLATLPRMAGGQSDLRVWVQYRERWYPGTLTSWNTRDGVLRGWVTYAVPVNGWPGGWYAMDEVEADDGHARNDDGLTWHDLVS
jgi:hypothetical protein